MTLDNGFPRTHRLAPFALAVLVTAAALLPASTGAAPSPALELLFEGVFVAEAGVSPHVKADDPFDRSFSMKRDLIAQGEGTSSGLLAGTVRWSLLGRSTADTGYGRIHLTGWVETPEGAEIFFTATGFALGESAALTASTTLIGSGHFEADLEPAYEWLNSTLTMWRGRYEPQSQTLSFQVWAPRESIAAAQQRETRP